MKNMDLVTSLGNLTLDNSHDILPDSLPFLSSTHCPFSRAQLNGVDDFLHRLFDARSEGFNDEIWVKSRDATLSRPQRTTNILERSDKTSVAAMLSRHLWWEGENDEEDNLVSWTSSFLFVLQYAFYRKRYHGTDFKTMFICTVDTRQLPADVYVRDMDLINAHSPLNSRLSDLQRIRLGPHYFGEFLSQGALRIEGHCSIVSMQDILDAGLFRLRPEFEGFETRPPTWANEVVRLRRTDASADEITRLDCGHVEIAEHIGHLFGARFKWPVVLACLALKPWDELETHLMDALTQPAFAEIKQLAISSSKIKVVASAGLPEVLRVEEIAQTISTNLLLDRALKETQLAKNKLKYVLAVLAEEGFTRKLSTNRVRESKTVILRDLEDIVECVLAVQEVASE